ncbi:hypothetical protein DL546_004495 [Coniochaeta pulveracea]|uniref:Uncharacterized protein n=1 Tax=Coniochaeta pulveracea TaxID=177199 RepID=A0A420YJB5_9PEZI|nr:hypothetical protein DL546_004495 [Coniochaeta pulveracea]
MFLSTTTTAMLSRVRCNSLEVRPIEGRIVRDELDGYQACFARCIIEEALDQCPVEDFCLRTAEFWYDRYDKCMKRHCGGSAKYRRQQNDLKVMWEKKQCNGNFTQR